MKPGAVEKEGEKEGEVEVEVGEEKEEDPSVRRLVIQLYLMMSHVVLYNTILYVPQ